MSIIDSRVGGLVSTADTTGTLQIQTNSVDAITIDGSQSAFVIKNPTQPLQIATKQYVDGTKSFTQNGYQVLPSGLILQWARINTNASGNANVVYPIAFPNVILSVNANFNSVSNFGYLGITVQASTLTSTNFYLSDVSGVPVNDASIACFAIGY